jgi:hypothetical protein
VSGSHSPSDGGAIRRRSTPVKDQAHVLRIVVWGKGLMPSFDESESRSTRICLQMRLRGSIAIFKMFVACAKV